MKFNLLLSLIVSKLPPDLHVLSDHDPSVYKHGRDAVTRSCVTVNSFAISQTMWILWRS